MVVLQIDWNTQPCVKLLTERGCPSVGFHTPLVPLDQRGVRSSLFHLLPPLAQVVSGGFFVALTINHVLCQIKFQESVN